MSSAAGIVELVLRRYGLLDHPTVVGATSEGLSPAFVNSGELGGHAVTEHIQMYAASVTKQLVAALAARAAVSGQLDPECSVRHVLEELPAWFTPIRIRHLVHHVSGAPSQDRVIRAVGVTGENELSNQLVLEGLARLDAPERLPGVAFEYSNVGYVCLAEVVVRVTGADLDELAQRSVFAPLGLASSRLGGAASFQQAGLPSPPPTVGDGGWWTTAGDLLRWLQALNAGELGDEVTHLLETPGGLDDGTPLTYAWGVAVSGATVSEPSATVGAGPGGPRRLCGSPTVAPRWHC